MCETPPPPRQSPDILAERIIARDGRAELTSWRRFVPDIEAISSPRPRASHARPVRWSSAPAVRSIIAAERDQAGQYPRRLGACDAAVDAHHERLPGSGTRRHLDPRGPDNGPSSGLSVVRARIVVLAGNCGAGQGRIGVCHDGDRGGRSRGGYLPSMGTPHSEEDGTRPNRADLGGSARATGVWALVRAGSATYHFQAAKVSGS